MFAGLLDCSLANVGQVCHMRLETVSNAATAGLYVGAELGDIGLTRLAHLSEIAATSSGLFGRHA
jgi:hypothetical protein